MKSTHVGFNFQWMYHGRPPFVPEKTDLKVLDFFVHEGFSFVRLPLNYWYWIKDFAYDNPDEKRLKFIDSYMEECVKRNIHVSLNLHRAPGYCINGAELEKHNLWKDQEAQDAFTNIWKNFALRYTRYSSEELSFDLLNEPPNIDQYGMTREIHKNVMARVIGEICKISPDRIITLDGLAGGNMAMPEMAEYKVIQSVRGYQPMSITHHKASWCAETKGLSLQPWPGAEYNGKKWGKNELRQHYSEWKAMNDKGVPVHVGEMGCYNSIPNDTALAWFKDLFELFVEYKWGFSLWNFEGPFGVVNHGRPGTRWENYKGYKIDIELWELIKHSQRLLQQ